MYPSQPPRSNMPPGVPTAQNPGGMQQAQDPLQFGLQATTQALRKLAQDAAMQGASELSMDCEQMALKLRKHGEKRQAQFSEAQDILKGASLAAQM